MKMNRNNAALIADLTEDLAPVRAMRPRDGYLLVGLSAAVSLFAVWLIAGLWDGVVTGTASPFFIIANGLLLLVGLAAIGATVALASPHVGSSHDGPGWALAMLGVLPVTALAVVAGTGGDFASMADPYALSCLASGTAAGSLTFVGLAFWLRRGAPVSTTLAGTMAGIASGAVGSFVYGLSCPIDGLSHLGIWHVLPVMAGGALGRIALPRLIRW